MTWLVHHPSSSKVCRRLQSRVFRISSFSWHLTFITDVIWPNLFLNGFLNTYLPKYLSGLDMWFLEVFIHPMETLHVLFPPTNFSTEAASVEASMVINSRHVSDRRLRAVKDERFPEMKIVQCVTRWWALWRHSGKMVFFFFWLGWFFPPSCLVEAFF